MHRPVTHSSLKLLVAAGIATLLGIKLYLAARLDLYSDEIFYWLASTHLAPAYSDLPFMTSILVWFGSILAPGNTLAVRLLFVLLGSSIPLLVYWLARPVTDHSNALMSALLALCVPLGGFLGLLAVPDVPLLFFGLLTIGFFERSLRTNRLIFWIATGLSAALGLSTHYRFFLYPLSALLFLLAFPGVRRQWLNPRLWLAVCLACLGLIPVIWFNLNHQLASASFYLVERHPWTFQSAGLLHLFKQAGLVTPPLYILLAATLWHMWQLARRGDRNAALFASFSSVNLLVYLLLAPWTDSSSTSIHWPLSGYFPILVYAPAVLQAMYRWIRSRWNARVARFVYAAIPVLGFCGSLTALAAIGSQAFQAPLQTVFGSGLLSTKMAGWRGFAAHTATLLNRDFAGGNPVVVTDNYYTAAQLKFAGVAEKVYTTDNDKSVRDGRRLQFQLWEMDESALTGVAGSPALYITEDSTLNIPDLETSIGIMCRHVDRIDFQSSYSQFNGDKNFSYYKARSIVPTIDHSAFAQNSCPFPARAWIDPPVAHARLSGTTHIEGWAYKEDIGIRSVYLLIDGEEVAPVNYGVSRPDVVEVMNVRSDPNAPDLGYYFEFDTRIFPNGTYRLEIKLVDSKGVTTLYGERPVSIAN